MGSNLPPTQTRFLVVVNLTSGASAPEKQVATVHERSCRRAVRYSTLSKHPHQQYPSVCCLERHHRHARNSTMSSSYMPPGVPPRSSRVHRPSPGRIRRALRDATARPASYPHRTPPGRGGEVLTQQSNGGGDHVDRLNDEPLGKPR